MSRHPTARAGKKMLGRYRIEAELGRGGMGVVYVATDENTERRVALKTTTVAGLGSGEKARNQRRERFIREVRALTQVNHQNVVHVFDAGEVDDPDLGWLLFYTMEYVEGTTLAALVQERGALGPGEAAAVVLQVAAGLGEAHRQGIIHRDVKPANIFLSNDGRALIGDFGIAKIEGSTQITRRDQLVGTPNYLAPEQILGEGVGPATDVFALGALFYVITQNRPLRQQVDAAALLASANGNEPVQRMLATNLPDALRRTVARCLEREPQKRYANGAAFAEALADHATRVPSLAGSQPAPAFLNERTADRSSAFATSTASATAATRGSLRGAPSDTSAELASLPDAAPGAPQSFGFDASSVEAMAREMLGEVERRSTGTFKQPPLKQAPLPVARTESTAMFNLMALEAEHRPPAPPSPASPPPPASPPAPLPVARSEPTGMFRLHSIADTTATTTRPSITLEPVSDEGGPSSTATRSGARAAPLHDPTLAEEPGALAPGGAAVASASFGGATPADVTVEVMRPTAAARGRPSTAAVYARRLEQALAGAFAGVPRHTLVAAALGLGLACGALAAVVGRPPSTAERLGVDEGVAVVVRPALCVARGVTAEQGAQAAALLDEARALKRDAAPATQVVERLRSAAALDPTNHQLFYELGRVVSGSDAADADTCVCVLAPASRECSLVEKARGR